MRTIVTATLAAACLTSGCREGASPPASVATVSVALENSDLFVGLTTSATAQVVDVDGNRLSGRAVTWTSSEPTVATIGGAGATAVIVAVGPGTTDISASSEGVTGLASLRVTTAAFAQISVGHLHTCGLTTSGSAWCWGLNTDAQLGNGIEFELNRPQPTQVVGGLTFVEVAAGVSHTCGLSTSSAVYCWGSNHFRQLGNASDIRSPIPVRVSSNVSFRAITAGPYSTCGLSTTGDVYCWGASFFPSDRGPFNVPTLLQSGKAFVELRALGEHWCARTTSTTFCWGVNGFGQLGDGTTTHRTEALPVVGAPQFVRLAGHPGGRASCGLTVAGSLWCWGSLAFPDGSTGVQLVPTLVPRVPPLRDIGLGEFLSCVLTVDGGVLCWGNNQFGQLGDGTTIDRPAAAPVSGNLQFVQIGLGYLHACGLTNQGVAFCWGRNAYGELGDGTFTNRLTPTRVK